jgi:hypothetical protein
MHAILSAVRDNAGGRSMTPIRAGHALVATNILLLVALVWSHTQSRHSPPLVTDVVQARLIELVDERGQIRAQLHIDADGGGNLRLRNGQGEVRVKLGATTDGAGLLLMDQATEPGVRLATDRSGPSLKLSDPDKRERTITP